MAIKTISLELDAYEKLRNAKRGGESFSAVVRRAKFDPVTAVVEEPRTGYGATAGSVEVTADYWEGIEASQRAEIALESYDAASQRQLERNQAWKGEITDEGRSWTRDDLYQEQNQ